MKRRLLFVITTTDFGGTESFLLRLISGLDRDRFDPVVCSLCPPGRIGGMLEDLGVTVETLGMAPRAHPLGMLAGAWRLARLMDRCGAELVQSLLYRANVLAALARPLARPLGSRRPALVTGQRSLIPAGRGKDALAQRWTRGWADRVVAVSEAVRRELLTTESVEPERVVVIQNGIDLEHFRPGGDRAAARSAWNLPADAVVVGAVGRLHGPKGVVHLVDAVDLGRRRGLPLVLVLAGSGPEEESLRRKVEAQGLGEHVRFLGYVRDPRPLFPGFDLYALPSLAEGSPNALLEAMGCGCACVASAVGGVPEAVVDGESGLLVPHADPEALADAIVRLAAELDLRRQLGDAARRRVEDRFDLKDMVRHHEALYLNLLDSPTIP
ncbi:MAG: glycosyltransferase [Acidobacteriota bacterium]